MPTGNYAQQCDIGGGYWSQTNAVSEPTSYWTRNQGYGVAAKEPDRQSAARRGAQAGRGRGAMEDEARDQPTRGRATSRAGAGRRSAQARRGGEATTARRTSGTESRTNRPKKSRRGFAAMSPEQQREIARKGGLTVSRNRRHMADIGRIGGEHSHGGRRSRR